MYLSSMADAELRDTGALDIWRRGGGASSSILAIVAGMARKVRGSNGRGSQERSEGGTGEG